MDYNYKETAKCLMKAVEYVRIYFITNDAMQDEEVNKRVTKLIEDCDSAIENFKRDFVIECLEEAISYCRCQYLNSEIDWMPPASDVGLCTEHEKYDLVLDFISSLK